MSLTSYELVTLIISSFVAYVACYRMATGYSDRKFFEIKLLTEQRFEAVDNRISEIKDAYSQRIDDLKEDLAQVKKELHDLRTENFQQSNKIIELISSMSK